MKHPHGSYLGLTGTLQEPPFSENPDGGGLTGQSGLASQLVWRPKRPSVLNPEDPNAVLSS